jgi:type I restriction enzyme S subunit
MNATIDLAAEHLVEVRRILARVVPGCEVRAFGSRVTGGAQRYSDLDLALVGAAPVNPRQLEALRDAFSASDLPMTVDVLDWAALGKEFRLAIGDRFAVIQAPAGEGSNP